ncbi:hypothetical protein DOTSEDRAFT_75967 [Dothistroma septosporum NZE10]|uniref:Transglycosylase SLT domain-containing protein n=1 Tax=Dothistroma septosporum (strain NZE10 / CBS 128990) TaxID=675120 RepID=M2YHS4_DOTSN|nr:hypothetical protein DOTSEDRAFT_75967 [Dothistroma septosporum NZE10]
MNMAPTFPILLAATLALTSCVSAIPNPGRRHHQHHAHLHEEAKRTTYTPCLPSGWTSSMTTQWDSMQSQELAALKQETLSESLQNTTANNYAQAGFTCPVASAFAPSNPWQIMLDCPLAQAANNRQRENFPAFGSMDLTAADIATIYAPAIAFATAESGVPAEVLRDIIWTESKGHPLTSNGGLTQIDPNAWAAVVDGNECMKGRRRYVPRDNVLAAALFLKSKDTGGCGSGVSCWMGVYKTSYQG